MLNRLKNKFRIYWHDLYYGLVSTKGIKFAMTCQEATEKIDLGLLSQSKIEIFRVKLHVSLCQACNNYDVFSQRLREAIKRVYRAKVRLTNLERLNQELVRKHSQIKTRN